jgi:nucleoside-diphosphate-sugar epimerase
MQVSILGRKGLIGKVLWHRFPDAFNYVRKDVDVIFWFAAPSSQVLFHQAPEYCTNETLDNMMNLLEFCSDNNIKLVYPSSATVYNLNNDYAKCKAEVESLANKHEYKNVLGLRIFAGYGDEWHKGEYASVVFQFCKMMKQGKRPIILGDGTQTRDFIYVEDIVDNILLNIDKTGIIDIGSGISTSFNDLVKIINEELGTNIQPIYIDKPSDYIQDTPCKKPSQIKYSLREGVREILRKL